MSCGAKKSASALTGHRCKRRFNFVVVSGFEYEQVLAQGGCGSLQVLQVEIGDNTGRVGKRCDDGRVRQQKRRF
jgi:hypothetical protein